MSGSLKEERWSNHCYDFSRRLMEQANSFFFMEGQTPQTPIFGQFSEVEEKPFPSSLFKYLFMSLLQEGVGANGVTPPPPTPSPYSQLI
jgi:hypothetical protein